jgi:transposase
MGLPRWVGRAIGLDVHREFCEVAICEDGVTRSAGRVPATPDGICLLAESLLSSDRVALEVTGSCWEVARLLEPHVNRVVVVSPDDTGIASARAKTDKLDARALASLLWKGELEAVWMPDERCRILRRRLSRREQLVHSRSRVKNEIHACLQRRLQGKPPSESARYAYACTRLDIQCSLSGGDRSRRQAAPGSRRRRLLLWPAASQLSGKQALGRRPVSRGSGCGPGGRRTPAAHQTQVSASSSSCAP